MKETPDFDRVVLSRMIRTSTTETHGKSCAAPAQSFGFLLLP
jgi:hypothetical protein